MSFTTLKKTQVAFLEEHLRGTNRTLTSDQARALYGIKNLRARVYDLRQIGLNVQTMPTKTTTRAAYKVSRRDIFGLQGKIFQ